MYLQIICWHFSLQKISKNAYLAEITRYGHSPPTPENINCIFSSSYSSCPPHTHTPGKENIIVYYLVQVTHLGHYHPPENKDFIYLGEVAHCLHSFLQKMLIVYLAWVADRGHYPFQKILIVYQVQVTFRDHSPLQKVSIVYYFFFSYIQPVNQKTKKKGGKKQETKTKMESETQLLNILLMTNVEQ